MKKMVYTHESKVELLHSGKYRGYSFYILNLGTHPTAYIDVQSNPNLTNKDYFDIDLSVHGGLTYSSSELLIGDKTIYGWFIGWDYAHAYDYYPYPEYLPMVSCKLKKWSTEEIFEDVKKTIKLINKGEYEIYRK